METRTAEQIIKEIKSGFELELEKFTKGNPEILGKDLTNTLFNFYATGFDNGMGISIEEMSKRCL